jgi:5-methylthioadenosine/S-adenosylhomocysteine deaminase
MGADWLPSGSPSLLDELRVAAAVLKRQGSRVEAKRLVGIVTSGGAKITDLGDELGRIRRVRWPTWSCSNATTKTRGRVS